jgi:hypothetical protein
MPGKAHKNQNNRNKTKKSPLRNLLKNDPILAKMWEGKLLWGDIERNIARNASKKKKASPKKANSPHSRNSPNSPNAYYMANDALENFKIPDLAMRKGIWTHFPVIVNEIGANLYEVVWHQANLKEWRASRPATWDEWMEYEAYTEIRLLHALRAHGDRYEILPPVTPLQILTFRQRGVAAEGAAVRAGAGAAAPAPAAPVAAAARRNVPVLRRLNDIKEHFPILWDKVPGRAGETTYKIQIRGDFQRKNPPAVVESTRTALIGALVASPAWTVLPAGHAAEVCRIEMKHEK